MAKSKLGSGQRFKTLVKEIKTHMTGQTARGKAMAASRPGGGKIKNPAALAAVIGRKKYGKKRFQQLAARGRSKRA